MADGRAGIKDFSVPKERFFSESARRTSIVDVLRLVNARLDAQGNHLAPEPFAMAFAPGRAALPGGGVPAGFAVNEKGERHR